MLRRLKDTFRNAEVTLSEYDVLYTLASAQEGRLRLRDLNEGIMLTQPSLSRLVERMERDKMVSRQADPYDGRGTLVALTQYGQDVYFRVGRHHAECIERYVGGGLTQRELVTLKRLCDKLRRAQERIPT